MARSVLVGLGLVALVALWVPFASYRNDVREIRHQFQSRIVREAKVHSEALGLHFRLLQAELERLAQRPEIDFRDGTNTPEQEVLDFAHRNSTLFRRGVVLLDGVGTPVVSEPKGLFQNENPLTSRPWFQKILAFRTPVIQALSTGSQIFVVAVPITRDGALIGVLLGLVDPSLQELAGGRSDDELYQLLVVDRLGNFLLPQPFPAWASSAHFLSSVENLKLSDGQSIVETAGGSWFAATTPVGTTDLRLLLLANERLVVAPVRGRFLLQLLFIAVIQLFTLLLFSLYLRRSYLAFVAMETQAAEHQKMAALGSAALLIAHEVKNSLNGLSAAATLLGTGAEPGFTARAIKGQIERLRHLATSLLHFGKPPLARLEPIQLDQIVRETIESLRVLPEAEDVVLHSNAGGPIRVRCDPFLLMTALDNLIRNAIEAAVAAKDVGKVLTAEVSVSSGLANGQAFVTVEDNAGGIAPELEGQLFEPFVSAKPKGIGLGLSMAKKAVETQGGSLAFERTGVGSRFTVKLRAS